ncbi:MAG: agmatinase [Desulforhopalus sp.]|jgi:agmatinase
MTRLNFHGEDVVPAAPGQALFHIIPVPLEQTVSYGAGTVNGPHAILEASAQLELFDGVSIPADYGIHTAPPLPCDHSIEQTLLAIEQAVAGASLQKSVPVLLGGEHSLSLGAIKGLKQHYGDFGVVQFDAHADLRDSYSGTKNSHACVMRRIVEEDIPIYQFGTRSYSLEEQQFREEKGIWYRDAETIWRDYDKASTLPPDCPEKIFITFDVDCFDASVMPATGTPVPGGLNWYQVVWAIQKMLQDKICLGFDLVELAPQDSMHGASFSVAQLAYNMMGYLTRSAINRTFYNLS